MDIKVVLCGRAQIVHGWSSLNYGVQNPKNAKNSKYWNIENNTMIWILLVLYRLNVQAPQDCSQFRHLLQISGYLHCWPTSYCPSVPVPNPQAFTKTLYKKFHTKTLKSGVENNKTQGNSWKAPCILPLCYLLEKDGVFRDFTLVSLCRCDCLHLWQCVTDIQPHSHS